MSRILPRYIAFIVDSDGQLRFEGKTIDHLLRQIRRAFPASQVACWDHLLAVAQQPVDSATAARALGITKHGAHKRLTRGVRAGWLVRLRRGLYQRAP